MSENVKRLREEKNLSQSELARLSGVSQSYISELEDGKAKNPSIKTLGKIAEALGVTVTAILEETKEG